MIIELIQLPYPKENYPHVTLSLSNERRAGGDLEGNSLYFAIRCCNTYGYCMFTVLQESPLSRTHWIWFVNTSLKYGHWKLWNYPLFSACKVTRYFLNWFIRLYFGLCRSGASFSPSSGTILIQNDPSLLSSFVALSSTFTEYNFLQKCRCWRPQCLLPLQLRCRRQFQSPVRMTE